MKPLELTGGIVLIIVSILIYIRNISLILFLISLIIGIYLTFEGIRIQTQSQLHRKVGNVIYKGLEEKGIEKIKKGELKVSEEEFMDDLSRLRSYILKQSNVPIIGFNSIYLNYGSESEAEKDAESIRNLGFECQVVNDKNNFSIKIEL
ncbi:hypothetical protein [Caldiplasma sukawensis]